MQLKGAKILLTGASSGIGRALAIELTDKGADLILCGRNLERLKETSAQCQGGNVQTFQGDLSQSTDRVSLAEFVEKSFGKLDLLINNAGMVGVSPVATQEFADVETMVQTNLMAPIHLSQLMLPFLSKASQGTILNIGSMFGDIAYPYFAVYSATKFGLRGFSDALRRELAGQGIKVVYAAPRATQTTSAKAFEKLISPFDMALDPPEKVAGFIVKGLVQGKKTIYPPSKERFFVLVQKLLPGLIDQETSKQMKRCDF